MVDDSDFFHKHYAELNSIQSVVEMVGNAQEHRFWSESRGEGRRSHSDFIFTKHIYSFIAVLHGF